MTKPRNDLTIYNTVADLWWSDEVRWVRTLQNMVPARLAYFDRFMAWQGAEVLDIGCAGGFMAEGMALKGARVTGIDPAADAIAAARAHAEKTGLTIRYDVGSGENLPYADAGFDAVICVDVLEHVSDLPRVLSETARVLRPGGLFLFDTINRNLLAKLVTVTLAEGVLRLLPHGTHDPGMFITPAELRAGLTRAGLTPGGRQAILTHHYSSWNRYENRQPFFRGGPQFGCCGDRRRGQARRAAFDPQLDGGAAGLRLSAYGAIRAGAADCGGGEGVSTAQGQAAADLEFRRGRSTLFCGAIHGRLQGLRPAGDQGRQGGAGALRHGAQALGAVDFVLGG